MTVSRKYGYIRNYKNLALVLIVANLIFLGGMYLSYVSVLDKIRVLTYLDDNSIEWSISKIDNYYVADDIKMFEGKTLEEAINNYFK